MPKEIDAFSNS